MNENTIMNMLLRYKYLTDFNDSMEKNNYKFVKNYIIKALKNKQLQDAYEFIIDAIALLEKWNDYKKMHSLKFN